MTLKDVKIGMIIERKGMLTVHEKAGMIMVKQPFQIVLLGAKWIYLISYDMDVFVLLPYLVEELKMNVTVYMQVTSDLCFKLSRYSPEYSPNWCCNALALFYGLGTVIIAICVIEKTYKPLIK